MRIPKLKTMGTCYHCKKPVEVSRGIGGSIAIEHKHPGQRWRCRGSNHLTFDYWYVIETVEEGLEVATFLRDDTSICLDRPSAGGHSMSCNDGRYCEAERKRIAKALAVYYLARREASQLVA